MFRLLSCSNPVLSLTPRFLPHSHSRTLLSFPSSLVDLDIESSVREIRYRTGFVNVFNRQVPNEKLLWFLSLYGLKVDFRLKCNNLNSISMHYILRQLT